ncbi:hypothetical protein K435DRAFT_851101 [Dendrothele bispora CBS 962.96]|uniref:Uncharacterized protein n=1 Tax=Dendrothele bispora (strain CBS 962.96) TaxID=1314807 RepID=A0A4V4HHV7_DENBC|nr:hypothetical protein K435DRAFT_851101 [Dendrothele bispora CBS 962.96]
MDSPTPNEMTPFSSTGAHTFDSSNEDDFDSPGSLLPQSQPAMLFSRPVPFQTPAPVPYTPTLTSSMPFEASVLVPCTPAPLLTRLDKTPIISLLAIENLANGFHLNAQQTHNLHTFVKMGSVGKGLDQADMLTHLYSLSVAFDQHNRRFEGDNNIDTLRAMLKDLNTRLEMTFTLTSEQNKNVCLITLEMLYDPLRTCYLDINNAVFDHLKKHKNEMRLTNVFDNPAREKILESAITRSCSSIRNGFRQHIRDSVGKNINLVTFTHQMNRIYLRPGGSKLNEKLLLLRNAILRRYIHDNPKVVWADEDGKAQGPVNEIGNGESHSMEAVQTSNMTSEEPPTKKRKLKEAAGSRVPKGQDFWSLIDKWFSEQQAKFGKRITGAGWKSYLEDIVRFDEAGFKLTSPLQPILTPQMTPDNQPSAPIPPSTYPQFRSSQANGNPGQGNSVLQYII